MIEVFTAIGVMLIIFIVTGGLLSRHFNRWWTIFEIGLFGSFLWFAALGVYGTVWIYQHICY